jgi:hypothetical protein
MPRLYAINPFFLLWNVTRPRIRSEAAQIIKYGSWKARLSKGPFIIYGGGWHRREMFFVAKILLTQPLKRSKIWLPNLKYQLKNKYPPLAKNFTKGWHSVVTYVLYLFCDMSLITDCEIFCSLKFHVVCICTFFGDTICLTTNLKMIKI